jgi:mRNA interferase MazF
MTSYKFADLVLVPFPFTDQAAIKKRPAVVVSSDRYNREHPDIIVMALTSQSQAAVLSDHGIIIDWQGAGLLKPSIIKPIVMTIEPKLILKILGKFQPPDQELLQTILKGIFEQS